VPGTFMFMNTINSSSTLTYPEVQFPANPLCPVLVLGTGVPRYRVWISSLVYVEPLFKIQRFPRYFDQYDALRQYILAGKVEGAGYGLVIVINIYR